ncbi:MAG TPA: ATP-dependent helicase [Gemmatimonadaceae bacterium]|nr:ATP-dependent helicase [Gemmatimonadaceae bacterium]
MTGVHRAIAAEESSPVHILAGPGTGKTFAMMRRIARFIEEERCSPKSILAVTFTRTAARDLKDQLAHLGIEGADEVRATTLHALCFSILSKQEVFDLTGRAARPILDFEMDLLIEDLADRFGGKRQVRKLIEAYEAAWARLQHEEPGFAASAEDQAFENALLDWLQYHGSMLIGELIPLTLRFLRQNPAMEVLPDFDHVLVDEYQDLNKADQDLIDKLAENGTLTIIGDDNQSIYSFRHANPEGIRTFQQTHPGTIAYEIQECRRCPPNIVAISNALISRDPNRSREVPLLPDPNRPAADVFVVQHRTLDDEVAAVGAFIDTYLKEHQDLPPGQALVLTPRRVIGNRIRDTLIRLGRNSLSYFLEDQLKSDTAAEGYALLYLLVSPGDRTALRAWLGIGGTAGRRPGYRRLRRAAERSGREPSDVLASVASGDEHLPHVATLVERWNTLQQCLGEIRELSGLQLVRALWPVENDESKDIRLVAENLAIENGEPAELLEALREAFTQPELPGSDGDIIRVMSLHKSKGLTAAVVVVAGCMAGALPKIDRDAPQAEQDAQVEEQRRLFYVAITRATRSLVISSALTLAWRDALAAGIVVTSRGFEGGVSVAKTAASRFIQELGPNAPRAITTAQWRVAAHF